MSYDVAVIGGGHYGLTCAAYLARAGKRVIVLEAKERVGGETRSGRNTARQVLRSEPDRLRTPSIRGSSGGPDPATQVPAAERPLAP